MRPHLFIQLLVAVTASLALPATAAAQTGAFVGGQPVFSRGAPPTPNLGVARLPGNIISVDVNRDAVPDVNFELPDDIQSDPLDSSLQFQDYLSPSQRVLYTRRFSASDTGCATGIRVYFHSLATPPTMQPLATGICLPAPEAQGPLFFDPVGESSLRTAALVTQSLPTSGRQAILWVDLVNGGEPNLDTSTYEASLDGQAGITFAPFGNAAFVRHGFSTAFPKYTVIDFCRSRIAETGSRTTQPLPTGGTTLPFIVESNGSLFVELRLNSTPIPGASVALDDCLVLPPISLDFGKASNASAVSAGQQFDYTLTVTNLGANDLHNVTVVDTVPSATRFISADHGGQLDAQNAVHWSIGTLSRGAQIQLTLTVEAACMSIGNIINDDYSVTTTETGTFDGRPVATGCFPPPPVQLAIEKTGPATVVQGDAFTYTFTYRNTGTHTANGVVIEELLPGGVQFVSATGNVTRNGSTITWNVGPVPSGGSGSVTLTVRAGCVPQIVNDRYSIRSSVSPPLMGAPIATNVIPASTAPIDVSVVSTVMAGSPPLIPDDLVQHVITLTNTDSVPRHGLRLEFQAGRGARFDQIVDAGGGAATFPNATLFRWSGSVPASATVSIIVTTRIEQCLTAQDTVTTLNFGQPLALIDACNRVLGVSAAASPFDLRPPLIASVRAVGPGTPAQDIFNLPVQVTRAGSEFDLQMTIVNQSAQSEPAAAFNMVLPASLALTAIPPFVPPSDAAAAYDPATRTLSWSGAVDAGQSVVVTVRAQIVAPACSARLQLSASHAACQNVRSDLVVTASPPVPGVPHVVGTDERHGLWMFTPGVDTAFNNLLCFEGETYNGFDRAANGDLWVAGLPSYRFNHTTLDLEVVDETIFHPHALSSPSDVAVQRGIANPKPVFLLSDQQPRASLLQYDPATGQATLIRTDLPSMGRIVIDGLGRIAGVVNPDPAAGTPGGVLLIDPADPANDRLLSDAAFPRLDVAMLEVLVDGTFIVTATDDPLLPTATQDLIRIDAGLAGSGTFSLLTADLAAYVAQAPFGSRTFRALTLGAAGDVYLGRMEPGSLGVVDTSGPSGALLAIGRNVVDMEFVDPSAVPPPPPPLSIEVLEAITLGDTPALLASLILIIEEQILVDDAPAVEREALDRAAPITTVRSAPLANLAGWHRATVTLTFDSVDEAGGSGLRRLYAGLTGAQTAPLGEVAAPLTISAEGITTVTYYAEDTAGNVEAARTLVVRIDRTAPEAVLAFDPAARTLAVAGHDALSGMASDLPLPVDDGRQRYDMADVAGNVTTVVVEVRPANRLLAALPMQHVWARIVSVQRGDLIIPMPENHLAVTSTLESNNGRQRLLQQARLDSGNDRHTVRTAFDERRGVTLIHDGGGPPQQRNGLVLLRLAVRNDGLSIEY